MIAYFVINFPASRARVNYEDVSGQDPRLETRKLLVIVRISYRPAQSDFERGSFHNS